MKSDSIVVLGSLHYDIYIQSKSIPKTVVGVGTEGRFKEIPQTIKNELSDAIRQDSSQKEHSLPETKLGPKTVERKKSVIAKNVISPLAARGVEIKRNLANRRQASSVPQKEIDVDKELESWKKVEEDVE